MALDSNDILRRDGRLDADAAVPFDLPPEPESSSSSSAKPSDDERPTLTINQMQDDELAEDAFEAMARQSELFTAEGKLARLTGDAGQRVAEAPTVDWLCSQAAKACRWIRQGKKDVTAVRVPQQIMRGLRDDPPDAAPTLHRILHAPAFAPSGAPLSSPGFDPASGYYLDSKLEVRVSSNPSELDIRRARNLLLCDLLDGFPFIGAADKAHAIAALLQPFVRALIDGATPLFMVRAHAPGTGKGLLCEVICKTAFGYHAVTPLSKDDEEIRKKLTSDLPGLPEVICYDNVPQGRVVDSASLCTALTEQNWRDRLLGVSTNVTAPVRCLWLMNGNGLKGSKEIIDRSVLIGLDAGIPDPRQRQGFKHELPSWAVNNRKRLVEACLTLCQAWIAAGRPEHEGVTIGRFEAWVKTLGGILDVAGIDGFLANRGSMRDEMDDETASWGAFAETWFEDPRFTSPSPLRTCGTRASELIAIAHEYIPWVLGPDGTSERGQQTKLGTQLKFRAGGFLGAYKLIRDTGAKTPHYILEKPSPVRDAAEGGLY